MPRPQFDVATSLFLPLLHFYVATSIRCRNLISVVSLFGSWSLLLFSCCDVIQQVGTQLCWSAYFLFATWSSRRDQEVSFISTILVTTSKRCVVTWLFFLFAEIFVVTSFLLLAILILVATAFFLPFNKFYVATWLSCCSLHSVSQPQFDVVTSFLLSATDSRSQLPFSCCDLKLFVCSLSCRDMGFRSRHQLFLLLAEIYVATLKSCQTSILPILSQPHF